MTDHSSKARLSHSKPLSVVSNTGITELWPLSIFTPQFTYLTTPDKTASVLSGVVTDLSSSCLNRKKLVT